TPLRRSPPASTVPRPGIAAPGRSRASSPSAHGSSQVVARPQPATQDQAAKLRPKLTCPPGSGDDRVPLHPRHSSSSCLYPFGNTKRQAEYDLALRFHMIGFLLQGILRE